MAAHLLTKAFAQTVGLAEVAVAGLNADQLRETVEADSNPIGWLVWHAARMQDQKAAELFGTDQLWTTGDWPDRFGLEPDPSNTGHDHSADDVHRVRPDSPQLLLDYLDAVQTRALATEEDVSLEERLKLVAVTMKSLKHLAKAVELRGRLDR